VIEEMGAAASATVADLHVIEIPDGSHYVVHDYDGKETLTYSATPIMGATHAPACDCCNN
jgi:hypothetical protein